MCFERARSDQQKEQRISEIMYIALRLFDRLEYDKITFSLIAKENGSARSNIYKYFNTKEEIYLEVLNRGIQKWAENVINTFPEWFRQNGNDISLFASWWITEITRDKTIVKIVTHLNSTIEKNVSPDALHSFKKNYKQVWSKLSSLLVQQGLFNDESIAFEFFVSQQALLVGFAPMYSLTKKQTQVMMQENIPVDIEVYEQIFCSSLGAVVSSLQEREAK